nr:thiosulfate:glutathione sulfurtransferase isoform X2 [Panthera onca]
MTLSPGAWAKPDRPRRAVGQSQESRAGGGISCTAREQVPRGQFGRRCLRFRFRSRLREAGEMLRARRGRPGAAFLLLAVAARAMAGVSELESALQMEPAAFQAVYSAEKPKRDDENLIFFCQMGKRGLQATQLAQGLGYTGARNYAGAYREWFQKEG